MCLLKTGELLYLCFLIPGMKEKLPVASSVDCYVFLKKFLMLYSDFFHNVDTFYAYNETIVNIIITSV